MKRKKVLQIVSGLAIGEQSGGAEQYAVRLAQNLNKNNFESAVFVMWKYHTSKEEEWLKRYNKYNNPRIIYEYEAHVLKNYTYELFLNLSKVF